MWLLFEIVAGIYLFFKFVGFIEWVSAPSKWIPKSPEVPKAQKLREAQAAREILSRDLDGRLILWVLDKLGAAESMAKAEAELASE